MAKNGVSRALFHTEIAPESNFDFRVELVLFCDSDVAYESNLVLAQSVLTLIVYKLYCCLFFL